jgi:addiction module HigA family antidote
MSDTDNESGVIGVDVDTVKTWFDDGNLLLVDVRETSEYDQEHIPGARLMPLSVFDPSMYPVLTDKTVVIHCALGRRSQTAGEKLIAAGLKNVRHMLGGIVEWKERGYATEIQRPRRSSQSDATSKTAAADVPEQLCPPPGRVLVEEYLEPLGISQHELAEDIGILPDVVDALVLGHSQVSAELSLRLARYFSTAPNFWLHIQVDHNLEIARRKYGQKVRDEVTPRTRKGL